MELVVRFLKEISKVKGSVHYMNGNIKLAQFVNLNLGSWNVNATCSFGHVINSLLD